MLPETKGSFENEPYFFIDLDEFCYVFPLIGKKLPHTVQDAINL